MMSLLSVELISGYFLQPSRLFVQKYYLARKSTPLTNKLRILRIFFFDIGRGRTAIFRAEGGQSSFRSITTVCTRRRRKADVAENSFAEKIGRDQLVFLFFGPCLSVVNPFVYALCASWKAVLYTWFDINWSICSSGQMRFEEHWHWCGAMLVLGELLALGPFFERIFTRFLVDINF